MKTENVMLCHKVTETELKEISEYNEKTHDWTVMEKYDGTRSLVIWDGTNLAMPNRRDNDILFRYPEFAGLKFEKPCILDCEVVCKDRDFNHLQHRESQRKDFLKMELLSKKYPCELMIFDILRWGDEDLTELPLSERLEILQKVITPNEWVQVAPSTEDLLGTLEEVRKAGGEGIVIKRKDSPYEFRRTKTWLKYKFMSEEDFEVVGYTSEVRGISALELSNGSKVNFGVDGGTYEYWAPLIKEGRKIIAKVRFHEKTKSGALRFPIIKELVLMEEAS